MPFPTRGSAGMLPGSSSAVAWPPPRLAPLLDESDELIVIFVKSITTAKARKP